MTKILHIDWFTIRRKNSLNGRSAEWLVEFRYEVEAFQIEQKKLVILFESFHKIIAVLDGIASDHIIISGICTRNRKKILKKNKCIKREFREIPQ